MSPRSCSAAIHGVPSENDAKPYIVNFKLADPDNDGTVDKKEFDAAYTKGLVTYTNQ